LDLVKIPAMNNKYDKDEKPFGRDFKPRSTRRPSQWALHDGKTISSSVPLGPVAAYRDGKFIEAFKNRYKLSGMFGFHQQEIQQSLTENRIREEGWSFVHISEEEFAKHEASV